MTEIKIEFGAMGDSIISQLRRQGYTLDDKDEKRIQNLVYSINMVRLHGLIPDGPCQTARKRLMKDIIASIKPVDRA